MVALVFGCGVRPASAGQFGILRLGPGVVEHGVDLFGRHGGLDVVKALRAALEAVEVDSFPPRWRSALQESDRQDLVNRDFGARSVVRTI